MNLSANRLFVVTGKCQYKQIQVNLSLFLVHKQQKTKLETVFSGLGVCQFLDELSRPHSLATLSLLTSRGLPVLACELH